jgi:hypothetical protein
MSLRYYYYVVRLLGFLPILMAIQSCSKISDYCGGFVGRNHPPPQAASVGYFMNTFSSQFELIDLADERTPGFEWYLGQFFGWNPTNFKAVALNPGGGITINGGAINTASPNKNGRQWVGVVFGGGAYIEAILRFDPGDTIKNKGAGWPSFWSMGIEHLAGLDAQQWPGEAAGYSHFIEADFFEYDTWPFSSGNTYGGAIHDWYGRYNESCPGKNYCQVSNARGAGSKFTNFVIETPSNDDFDQYHKYGFLWVPATTTAPGYAQYYYDDKATNDKIIWSKYDNQPPPPGTNPWTFGIIDIQHLAILLGTGRNEPMIVKSINVWQRSRENNLCGGITE